MSSWKTGRKGFLSPESLSPVQRHGNFWLKRDDLFEVAGVSGGKARAAWHIAQGATGLVTAGSRSSPQNSIVAHMAAALDIPCRCHVPSGALLPEVEAAKAIGAEIVQHRPGYNSVITKRARDDAEERGWRQIPFGMECEEAVRQTSAQVANLPDSIRRIVVPVGSAMSLAGILHGLADAGIDVPVLGIVVGADSRKRLNNYAPENWKEMCVLQDSGLRYATEVETDFPVPLDPIYEAKCVEWMLPGDLLWIVGIRQTASV